MQIIGLPEGAVREARERVRIALSNSGFTVVGKKILVCLGPADLPKASPGLDLAVALAVLSAEAGTGSESGFNLLAVGELGLHGDIAPVHGVLAAVDEAAKLGCVSAVVPSLNAKEASLCPRSSIYGVGTLSEAWEFLAENRSLCPVDLVKPDALPCITDDGVLSGSVQALRGIELAAAGRHHIGFFGPPGTGKTMSAHNLARILPPLTHDEMIQTARIWSIAEMLNNNAGVLTQPPVRAPHHSASVEGMIGGGKYLLPGEVSITHNGLLVLDEVAEFSRGVLQALREPLESGEMRLVRAGMHAVFPASSLVCLTSNLCPCGGFGKPKAVCACSPAEIGRYWRKFGGAVMDRIQIRVPCSPADFLQAEPLAAVRQKVLHAQSIQQKRNQRAPLKNNVRCYNSQLAESELLECGACTQENINNARSAAKAAGLSFRGSHHVLQIARTMADLDNSKSIMNRHLKEAASIRKIADGGTPWAYVSHRTANARSGTVTA